MRLFGRKRWLARQEQRAEHLAESYRFGFSIGCMLFENGKPCPDRPIGDTRTTSGAYEWGRSCGYRSAAWEQEDEIECAVQELACQGLAQLEDFLAHPYAAPPARWPTDDGPLDIHGGGE